MPARASAFEFIVDCDGHAFTYDININTNYNAGRTGRSGMRRLAHFLGVELARQNMIDNMGHDHSRETSVRVQPTTGQTRRTIEAKHDVHVFHAHLRAALAQAV